MEPELAEREERLEVVRARFAAWTALLESNKRKDEDDDCMVAKLVGACE